MPTDASRTARVAAPVLRTDPPALARLRADLRAADYTIARVEQLLGDLATGALRRENPVPATRALAGRSDACSVLYGLFTLGLPHHRAVIEQALPSLGVHGALDLGLIAAADGSDRQDDPETPMRARVDLSPYAATDDRGEINWWIASDLSELSTGAPLRADHVLGVGGASLTLARITPRDPVDRALDLGCGSGIQALHASRHARRVVATDLSTRALQFAAFNAALNEVEIELRQGSLFEPVAGERFDLIVTNPPFVISPPATDEAPLTYRDAGMRGDHLLRSLLAELPEHLAPGGRALMLGNWEITADADGLEHPTRWLGPARAQGVDAWVLGREREDPAEYAETWIRDGGITPRDPQFEPMQQAWLTDLAARDVAAIGFGYIALHRPTTRRDAEVVTEEVHTTGSGTLGEHMGASLQRIGMLAELEDAELLAARPTRADDLMERRHLVPGAFDPVLIELVQGRGFGRTLRVDQALAATVGALDGTLTLAQTIAAVCALTDQDVAGTTDRLLPQLREMLRTGMIDP